MKNLYRKYERAISFAALIIGFISDQLTLGRIDSLYGHIAILSYLSIAALSIIIVSAPRIKAREGGTIIRIASIAFQFAIGGLLSAFFVFYSRSAALSGDIVFILVLGALLLGNELFKGKYAHLAFQIDVFFISFFSYVILVVPMLIGMIGSAVFVLSGFIALVVIGILVLLLALIIPAEVRASWKRIAASIVGIYLAFNILYFTNIIPPIPLSIKTLGIYHSVERQTDGTYRVRYERGEKYRFFEVTGDTYHRAPGEPIYVFSSIFAPTKLNVEILHRWSYFDDVKGKWIESLTVGFPVSGGRSEGYRGYTKKENVFPGRWRVDVITEKGQLLGRKSFRIVGVASSPILTESTH